MKRSCGDWQLEFWKAVDGELPAEPSAEFVEHLRACESCREAVRGAAHLNRLLLEAAIQGEVSALESVAPHKRLSSRPRRSSARHAARRTSSHLGLLLALAAGILLIAGAALVLRFKPV